MRIRKISKRQNLRSLLKYGLFQIVRGSNAYYFYVCIVLGQKHGQYLHSILLIKFLFIEYEFS